MNEAEKVMADVTRAKISAGGRLIFSGLYMSESACELLQDMFEKTPPYCLFMDCYIDCNEKDLVVRPRTVED